MTTIRLSHGPPVLAAALTVCALAATSCSANGAPAEFPAQSIELIVPWAPGGSGDQTARLLSAEARDTCGTDIVVRNLEGSIGAVGYQAVSEADPDGYTLGIVGIELAIISHLGVSEISPESVRGVMQYSYQPDVYGVPADSPLETLDDALEAAETDGVKVATPGTGSIYHVSFTGMAREAGVETGMDNVPFDGSAPAVQAVLGSQTDMVATGAAEISPYVESGEIRALAMTGQERQEDVLPGVPTLAEMGMEWDSGAILGVVAPVDTPDDRVEHLTECLNEARQADSFTDWMDAQGLQQQFRDAAEFDDFLAEQHEIYGDTVSSVGIGTGGAH